MSVMNPLGVMASFVFPFIFIKDSSSNEIVKEQVFKLFLTTVLIGGTIFLMILIFFHDNESYLKKHKKELKENNSKSDLSEKSEFSDDSFEEKIPFSKQLKTVFGDLCYFFMFISGSLIFGTLGGTANTLNVIVSIWGYEQVKKNGIIYFLNMKNSKKKTYYFY